MSKITLDVLHRRVVPSAETADVGIVSDTAFGEDVAMTRIGNDILASCLEPIVGAIDHIGWLAMHAACNDVAARGIQPRWVVLLVLVPGVDDKGILVQIMRDARRAAEKLGVSIIREHAGYSAGTTEPLVDVIALGNVGGEIPVKKGGAHMGDHVLITKGIALEGAAILAHEFADIARGFNITARELREAKGLMNEVNAVPDALILAEYGASTMHDVRRGGILGTLVEMAHASRLCIQIDASLIPVHPVVNHFAETFKFDPLRMVSSGSLVAAVPPERIDDAKQKLAEKSIIFEDIGRVIDGDGVIVLSDGKIEHYREIRCEDDEFARMRQLYPRQD
ncbi:MAG: hydrogenase expression/formation protein HypE [Deltaproteobacteria bacterium]|nr:hydrogenase expression/formation protein HypE [Deltaproteobacteria bacterium]